MSVPDWMIAIARVHDLHTAAIATWGGSPGVKDHGCVEGSVGSAYSAALYSADDPDDPDPLTAALHVLMYLARNHCFTDGNKRVGWMAFVEMLTAMGLRIEAPTEDIVAAVEQLATSKWDVDHMRAWVLSPGRLLPWDPPVVV